MGIYLFFLFFQHTPFLPHNAPAASQVIPFLSFLPRPPGEEWRNFPFLPPFFSDKWLSLLPDTHETGKEGGALSSLPFSLVTT